MFLRTTGQATTPGETPASWVENRAEPSFALATHEPPQTDSEGSECCDAQKREVGNSPPRTVIVQHGQTQHQAQQEGRQPADGYEERHESEPCETRAERQDNDFAPAKRKQVGVFDPGGEKSPFT